MAYAKYFGPGTIFVSDPNDFNRIFDSNLSYNKGSWVPHMLRHVVGDTMFFNILTTYYADSRYQYGTATTEEFRDLCEDVSGMDLDWFFQQWIYEEYYPKYQYTWSSTPNGGGYDVSLSIDQLQTNHIFKMPIDITVTTALGDTTFVVWDSLATQDFTLSIDDEPLEIAIDKDNWILRTVVPGIADPTFHRGILVVNGVDLDYPNYIPQIWPAYEDSIFWGDYDMTFWDCFDETGLGYPANLPAPLGHGSIPADTLKQFSSVVWVGNNYNGDLTNWLETPIRGYIEAGGNVLLMTRWANAFIDETLRDYLGITWRERETAPLNTLDDCISTFPGLVDMPLTGDGSTYAAVFDTSLATTESHLLFKETLNFSTDRGIGVIRVPAGGGTHREDGARFALISGRPYRWAHNECRANVEFISRIVVQRAVPPDGHTNRNSGACARARTEPPQPIQPGHDDPLHRAVKRAR